MKQEKLFDLPDRVREDLWDDMPEYEHEDMTPYYSLIVNFESREAVELFCAALDIDSSRLGSSDRRRHAISYPEAEIGTYSDKRWR